MDQLRVLEHGGDRLCALDAELVLAEPAKWPRCSTGTDLLCGMVWRCAPYLSSFSDALSLMQLAMMMAEATPRFLFERSIFSLGLEPLSSSIGSARPSTLPKERCARGVSGR